MATIAETKAMLAETAARLDRVTELVNELGELADEAPELLRERVAKLAKEISMPIIDKMNGAAAPVFIDALQASANNALALPRQLLQIMASRGVTSPADVDKLDEHQLSSIRPVRPALVGR